MLPKSEREVELNYSRPKPLRTKPAVMITNPAKRAGASKIHGAATIAMSTDPAATSEDTAA